MKINVDCEHFKPTNKNGLKEKCHCKYLNRNFKRELKHYQAFMNNLERKRK
jgi:hypothetical protein